MINDCNEHAHCLFGSFVLLLLSCVCVSFIGLLLLRVFLCSYVHRNVIKYAYYVLVSARECVDILVYVWMCV